MPKGVAFCELWHCEGVANGTVERPSCRPVLGQICAQVKQNHKDKSVVLYIQLGLSLAGICAQDKKNVLRTLCIVVDHESQCFCTTQAQSCMLTYYKFDLSRPVYRLFLNSRACWASISGLGTGAWVKLAGTCPYSFLYFETSTTASCIIGTLELWEV